MNLIEEIDGHECLSLVELSEPEPGFNFLRIVVDEAKTGDEAIYHNLGGTGDAISVDETCRRYEITFGDYIAYCVRNESKSFDNESEIFDGRLFGTYSKSGFMEFVRQTTVAAVQSLGPYTHYGIYCTSHVIDVVSADAPQIRIVLRA